MIIDHMMDDNVKIISNTVIIENLFYSIED